MRQQGGSARKKGGKKGRGKGGAGGGGTGAEGGAATLSLDWDVKASRHVVECFDHGMYDDARQLAMMTKRGEEDGAIAKCLRDEIQSVARRAAAAVINGYSVEDG